MSDSHVDVDGLCSSEPKNTNEEETGLLYNFKKKLEMILGSLATNCTNRSEFAIVNFHTERKGVIALRAIYYDKLKRIIKNGSGPD